MGERNCGQELWRGLWAALGLAGWTVTPGASGQDGAPGERKGGGQGHALPMLPHSGTVFQTVMKLYLSR